MNVLVGFVLAMIPLLPFSIIAGWASLSLNRKFLPWFIVGLILPFIGVLIILCRRVKEKKVEQPLLKPVSNEEIFDPVLELEEPRRIGRSEIEFSARA